MLNTTIQGSMNNILSPPNICFYTFFGIIFSRINLFHRSGMNNNINTLTCLFNAFSIPNITNKIPHLSIYRLGVYLLHIILL
mgnify:CR=1 FL=1